MSTKQDLHFTGLQAFEEYVFADKFLMGNPRLVEGGAIILRPLTLLKLGRILMSLNTRLRAAVLALYERTDPQVHLQSIFQNAHELVSAWMSRFIAQGVFGGPRAMLRLCVPCVDENPVWVKISLRQFEDEDGTAKRLYFIYEFLLGATASAFEVVYTPDPDREGWVLPLAPGLTDSMVKGMLEDLASVEDGEMLRIIWSSVQHEKRLARDREQKFRDAVYLRSHPELFARLPRLAGQERVRFVEIERGSALYDSIY